MSRGSSMSEESSASPHLYSMVPETDPDISGMPRSTPRGSTRPTIAAMRGSGKASGSTRQLRKTGSNAGSEGSRQPGVPRQASSSWLSSGEVLIEVCLSPMHSTSCAPAAMPFGRGGGGGGQGAINLTSTTVSI